MQRVALVEVRRALLYVKQADFGQINVYKSQVRPTLILERSWRATERRPFQNARPCSHLQGMCQIGHHSSLVFESLHTPTQVRQLSIRRGVVKQS